MVAPELQPRVAGKVRDKVTAWWREPWVLGPSFAALIVIVFISFGPGLRQTSATIEQVDGFPLFATARGNEFPVTPSAKADSFTLYMDKTWDGSADSYRAVILEEASGKQRAVFSLKDPGKGLLEISVPAGALVSGRYVLVVEGASGQQPDLARYPFTLQFK
jgi:hypothetical protein